MDFKNNEKSSFKNWITGSITKYVSRKKEPINKVEKYDEEAEKELEYTKNQRKSFPVTSLDSNHKIFKKQEDLSQINYDIINELKSIIQNLNNENDLVRKRTKF